MPIYEYRCDSCQKIHEVMQKFSDAPLELCPDCGSLVTKQMSLSAFSLKGTGWYATDYKGKSTAPAKPAETKSEVAPVAAPPKVSDSKPVSSEAKK